MLEILKWLMLILYIPACIGLIAVVLLQKGKGVGFAGAFGIGPGSDTVFGPRMSRSLPVRLTQIAAGIFLLLAFGLSYISGKVGKGEAPEIVPEDATTSQSANPAEMPAGAVQGLEDLGSATGGGTVAVTPASAPPAEGGTVAVTPAAAPPAEGGTVAVTPVAAPPAAPAEAAPAAPAEAAPVPAPAPEAAPAAPAAPAQQ